MTQRFDMGGRRTNRRYRDYINSAAWFRKKMEKLKAVGRRCEKCKSGENLEVHHLNYERLGCELMTDLKVLCNTCHFMEHGSIGSTLFKMFGSGLAVTTDHKSEKEQERAHRKIIDRFREEDS